MDQDHQEEEYGGEVGAEGGFNYEELRQIILEKCSAQFASLDTNGDGAVDREELRALSIQQAAEGGSILSEDQL